LQQTESPARVAMTIRQSNVSPTANSTKGHISSAKPLFAQLLGVPLNLQNKRL